MVDLVDEFVEAGGWFGHVVGVPAAVAVCAVEPPVVVAWVVAELRDGLAGPVGTEFGVPGWPAFVDGDVLAARVALDAEFVAVSRRDFRSQ